MGKTPSFFDKNPSIDTLEAFVVDVNGMLRGKKIPKASSGKVFKGAMRLPVSAFAVDAFGQDVLAAGLVAETGDNDGTCIPIMETLRVTPWQKKTAQVLLTMEDDRGRPFFADPRQVLSNILDLFTAKGLTPVVAAEMEFYLLDSKRDERGYPQPPVSKRTGRRSAMSHVYGIAELEEFQDVLSDINKACVIQGIPADTTISENGPGQYEINLNHIPDARRAADHALLMKRAVRGVARRHDIDATFMAKPYGNKSGNGLHVHFSILDKKGNNIFAGKNKKGSPFLRYAIGGLLHTMRDCTAIFAPNLNSYRRFAAGSHAPTTVSWGYDNRSAALRVPDSDIAATRIEHRVSGADANPYLMLAAILAGAYHGIVNKIDSGKPFTGNVYNSKAERLPSTWESALQVFEQSKFISEYFGKKFQKLYLACKFQEKEQMERLVSSLEHDAYLREI